VDHFYPPQVSSHWWSFDHAARVAADVRRAAGPPQLKRSPPGRLAAVRAWLAALVV